MKLRRAITTAAILVAMLPGAILAAPKVRIVGYRPSPADYPWKSWPDPPVALPWGASIAIKGEGFYNHIGQTLEFCVYFGTEGMTQPVYAFYEFDPLNLELTNPKNCHMWKIIGDAPVPPFFPPPDPYRVLSFNIPIGTDGKFQSDPPGNDPDVEADDPGVIWLRLDPHGGPDISSGYYYKTAKVVGGLPPSVLGDGYRAAKFYAEVYDPNTSPPMRLATSSPFYVAAPFDVRREGPKEPLLTITTPLSLSSTLPGRATRVHQIAVRNYTTSRIERIFMAVYSYSIPVNQPWRTEAAAPPGQFYVMWRTDPPGQRPNYHKDYPPIDFANFMVRNPEGDLSKNIVIEERREDRLGANSFLLSVRVPRFLPPGNYVTGREVGPGGVAIFCDIRDQNRMFEPSNGEPYLLFDVLLPVPEFRFLKLLTPVLDLGAWPAGKTLDSGDHNPPRGFVIENRSNVGLSNLKPLLVDIQSGLPLPMRSDEVDRRSPYGHIVVPGRVTFRTVDLLGSEEGIPPWQLTKPRVDAPMGTATDPIKVKFSTQAGTLIGTYYAPIYIFQDVNNNGLWELGETLADQPCWLKVKVKEGPASVNTVSPESMPAAFWDERFDTLRVWFCRHKPSPGGPRWRLYSARWREKNAPDGTWDKVQEVDISRLIPSGNKAPDPRYPDVVAYDCLAPVAAIDPDDNRRFVAWQVAVWYGNRNRNRMRPEPLYFLATARSADDYTPRISHTVSMEPKTCPTLYIDPTVGGKNYRLWLVWNRGTKDREMLMASFSNDYGVTWSAPSALWLGRGYAGSDPKHPEECFGTWSGVQNSWMLRAYSGSDFAYVRQACAVEDYWRNPGDGKVYPCMLLVFSAYSNYLGQEDLYIARVDPRVLGNAAYSPLSNSGLIPFPRRREVLKADPKFKVVMGGRQIGFQVYRAKHPAWVAPAYGNFRPLIYVNKSLLTPGGYTLDEARGRLVYKDPATGRIVLVIDPSSGMVTFSQPLPANSVVEAEYAPTVYRITDDPSPDFAPRAVNDKAWAKDTATGKFVPDWRLWVFWNKRDLVTGKSSLYVQTTHFYRQDPASPNDDLWDLTWLRKEPPKDLQPGPVPIHAAPGEEGVAVAVHIEPSTNPRQGVGVWPGQLLRVILVWPSVRSGGGDLYWCAYLPPIEPGL